MIEYLLGVLLGLPVAAIIVHGKLQERAALDAFPARRVRLSEAFRYSGDDEDDSSSPDSPQVVDYGVDGALRVGP